ncbi:flagellar hook capping FlgD N-terminal domain-containing protein [Proteinivorax tanatarense]|uniref:Flagellar hook capping FlgD N-terminal domain-containing protein n=1 Tax=Proteinivorax tanatarense TaxID=1260629 RepID=A0AAU7VPZ4_9FIRM
MKISNDTGQMGPKNDFNAALGKDDFLKILVAQLKYQDPLDPQDDSEFISQMTQFSSLEQVMNISNKMDKMVEKVNSNGIAATNAFSLVGKSVEIKTGEGTVVGIVDKVVRNDNSFSVEVDNKLYDLDKVEAVMKLEKDEDDA